MSDEPYFNPFHADPTDPESREPFPNERVAWYDANTSNSYGPMLYSAWPDFARANLNIDGSPKTVPVELSERNAPDVPTAMRNQAR